MKRLIAGLLLAGLMHATPARAADPHILPATVLPTTPQTPAPVLGQNGLIQASGVMRVHVPLRERIPASPVRSDAPPAPMSPPMPLPTGYSPGPQASHSSGPYSGYAGGGCATPDCGTCAAPRARGASLDRVKAWLCYKPCSGNVLPVFNPHPYVGPIAGMFPCTSTAGCGPASCGNGACNGSGCAATDACRGGLAARFGLGGCRNGECVPPADNAIPGYHFAGNSLPAATRGPAPFAPLGYKPAAPTASQPVQPAQSVAPASQYRSPVAMPTRANR